MCIFLDCEFVRYVYGTRSKWPRRRGLRSVWYNADCFTEAAAVHGINHKNKAVCCISPCVGRTSTNMLLVVGCSVGAYLPFRG